MAATTLYSYMAADTDARFRAWGLAISTALQVVATKLSSGDSSGQIDWASVALPSTAYASAGYEMYQFTDALQASCPVFIKIEYGKGGFGSVLGMWVTVGVGHDGAGGLVGFQAAWAWFTNTQNYDVSTQAISFLSGASNRLAFALRFNPGSGTNQPWSFAVERTHAADGTDTSYGVMILNGNGASYWRFQLLTFSAGVITTETEKISVFAPSVGHGSAGGTTAVYPVWGSAGPYLCQMGGFVFAFAQNITSGVPFSVSLLGGSKTFMPYKASVDSGLQARGPELVQCVRYD